MGRNSDKPTLYADLVGGGIECFTYRDGRKRIVTPIVKVHGYEFPALDVADVRSWAERSGYSLIVISA